MERRSALALAASVGLAVIAGGAAMVVNFSLLGGTDGSRVGKLDATNVADLRAPEGTGETPHPTVAEVVIPPTTAAAPVADPTAQAHREDERGDDGPGGSGGNRGPDPGPGSGPMTTTTTPATTMVPSPGPSVTTSTIHDGGEAVSSNSGPGGGGDSGRGGGHSGRDD